MPRDGNQPAFRLPDPLPPAAERLHRRQRLATAFRLFSRLGFEVGLAGHFTARDPIQADHFWVNPLGMSFAEIRASDLILVSPMGEVVDGEGMVNLSGVPYHDAIQRARPEVVGIAHAHAFHAKVWSAFGRMLDPITADAAMFHDDQVLFQPQRPEAMEAGQARAAVADQAVAALGRRNALIWQNHGHWTVGATVEAAEAAGRPIIPTTAARTPEVGAWLSFLPLLGPHRPRGAGCAGVIAASLPRSCANGAVASGSGRASSRPCPCPTPTKPPSSTSSASTIPS